MYKNQLQEFAQQSCINLPSYACIREGPDHAPRFKARVNFNGEVFESPNFCSTLRQAEHAAAEVALKTLSERGPSRVLATRVLDETGVYKNLLQETAHRAGMKLPAYTTVRTGPGYAPVFTCTVELAGMSFSGESARTKKQAQKSAAMVAWFSLKELSQECSSSHHASDLGRKDEQDQVIVARYLSRIKLPDTGKPVQRDKRKLQEEFSPVMENVIPYSFGWSSYRMPHQNSTYSYLSPEYTMYQTWQQGVPLQHGHLLALPSASASIPRPRIFPLIRSIFRPEMSAVFCARDQELLPLAPGTSPFFYLSNNLLPVLDRSGSQVTIEEIEDNNQVQEEWLNKGVSSVCWRSNISESVFYPTDSSHCLQSFNNASNVGEQIQQKPITDKKDQFTDAKGKSCQSQTVQDEDFSWLPPGFVRNRGSIIEETESRQEPKNLASSVSLLSNAQHNTSASEMRIPVAIPSVSCAMGTISSATFHPDISTRSLPAATPRTPAVFTRPTRPRLEDSRNFRRMPCASQMAPAVQIRSVMPLCSSPVRRMPSSVQEGNSSREEKKKPEETAESISAVSTEFCKLQL